MLWQYTCVSTQQCHTDSGMDCASQRLKLDVLAVAEIQVGNWHSLDIT